MSGAVKKDYRNRKEARFKFWKPYKVTNKLKEG